MSATIELGYVVGVDLGKINNFTAIAVLRQIERVDVVDVVDVVDERDERRAVEASVAGLPMCGYYGWSTIGAARLPLRGRPKGPTQLLELVHLDRLPLGTSYPAVVEQLGELIWRPPLRGNVRLVIDALAPTTTSYWRSPSRRGLLAASLWTIDIPANGTRPILTGVSD